VVGVVVAGGNLQDGPIEPLCFFQVPLLVVVNSLLQKVA
jgi:hypothetical protein